LRRARAELSGAGQRDHPRPELCICRITRIGQVRPAVDLLNPAHRFRNAETRFLSRCSQRCRSPLAGDHAALAAAEGRPQAKKVARKRAPTSQRLRSAAFGLGSSAVLHSSTRNDSIADIETLGAVLSERWAACDLYD